MGAAWGFEKRVRVLRELGHSDVEIASRLTTTWRRVNAVPRCDGVQAEDAPTFPPFPAGIEVHADPVEPDPVHAVDPAPAPSDLVKVKRTRRRRRPAFESSPFRISDLDIPFVPDADVEPIMDARRCQALWAEILNVAIRDAREGNQTAIAFLTSAGEWRRWRNEILEMVGIDPDAFDDRIASVIAGRAA